MGRPPRDQWALHLGQWDWFSCSDKDGKSCRRRLWEFARVVQLGCSLQGLKSIRAVRLSRLLKLLALFVMANDLGCWAVWIKWSLLLKEMISAVKEMVSAVKKWSLLLWFDLCYYEFIMLTSMLYPASVISVGFQLWRVLACSLSSIARYLLNGKFKILKLRINS